MNRSRVDGVHEEISRLLPGYALDALDFAEERAVARHLLDCPACRGELLALREVAGHLAFAVPRADPGAAVKGALLARVEQSAVLASPVAAAATVGRIPAARRAPTLGRGRRRRPRPWQRRAYGLLAIVALSLVAVVGWNAARRRRPRTWKPRRPRDRRTIPRVCRLGAAPAGCTDGTDREQSLRP